jgi:hypothetical protein
VVVQNNEKNPVAVSAAKEYGQNKSFTVNGRIVDERMRE